MAEAPGGGGAPRQPKTVKQFSGMNTQNHRSGVPQGQFPWLENIQPIGPANLHSIPGRSLEITRIPPAVVSCPDAEPAEQELPVVCCYVNNGFGELTTNNAGMCAFANADGEFWAIVTESSGFGNGPYPVASPTQTFYITEPVQPGGPSCDLQDATADALPLGGGRTANFQSTQTPQGGVCGPAEERCYILTLANITPPIDGTLVANGPGYIGVGTTNTARTYFGEDTGITYLFEAGDRAFTNNAWAIVGGMLYSITFSFLTTLKQFCGWPIGFPNGTYQTISVNMEDMLPGWDDTTFSFEEIVYIHGTTPYLYILARGPWDGGPVQLRLFRILRSNLTYVTHWVLEADPNFNAPWGMFAFSDELIFMIQTQVGPPGYDIGFFRTADATTEVIDRVPSGCTPAGTGVGPAGQHLFYYQRDTGMYYLSYSGYGFGATNVQKIGPLVCPSNPEIPFGT